MQSSLKPAGRPLKEIRSYSRVLVELPEPAFSKLEKLARARRRTVANLVEEVITGLVDAPLRRGLKDR
jgi:hypothetical protein